MNPAKAPIVSARPLRADTTATITTSEGTRNYVAYIVDQTRVLLLEVDTNLVSERRCDTAVLRPESPPRY